MFGSCGFLKVVAYLTPKLFLVGIWGTFLPISLSLNILMLGSEVYTTNIPANVPKWNLSIMGNLPLSRALSVFLRSLSVLLKTGKT